MLALVATGGSGTGLDLVDVDEPQPLADEAVVEVRAVSLNRGEVRRLLEAAPGSRIGWDVAGVVRRTADNGSGPGEGRRVAGLVRTGGWAQRVAVPTDVLAEVPDGVTYVRASALPVAGLTALSALRRGGLLLGRRVLVTGAAGGVGRIAVQLATLAGALDVHGLVRTRDRGAGLSELGVSRVLVENERLDGPYDLVLEGVGGSSLSRAVAALAPGGTMVSYASSSPEPATLAGWYGFVPRASVTGLLIFDELSRTRQGAADLRTLATLVGLGRLDPQVTSEGSWREPDTLLQALLDREVQGKAVLHVD